MLETFRFHWQLSRHILNYKDNKNKDLELISIILTTKKVYSLSLWKLISKHITFFQTIIIRRSKEGPHRTLTVLCVWMESSYFKDWLNQSYDPTFAPPDQISDKRLSAFDFIWNWITTTLRIAIWQLDTDK